MDYHSINKKNKRFDSLSELISYKQLFPWNPRDTRETYVSN